MVLLVPFAAKATTVRLQTRPSVLSFKLAAVLVTTNQISVPLQLQTVSSALLVLLAWAMPMPSTP